MARSTGRRRERLRGVQPASLIPGGVGANVPTVAAPEDPLRTGMPPLDSIHARMVIASPQTPGRSYTILRTTKIDGYELEKATVAGRPAPGLLAAVPPGDSFRGTARKAAKLSIATAPVEWFTDPRSLILVPASGQHDGVAPSSDQDDSLVESG